MAIYGQTDGIVVGQPLNPNFGAANGAQSPSAGFIQQPTTAPVAGGMQATGVQMPLLEAVSRGIIPRNANIATIAGQAVSAGVSTLQGDGVTLDEALSSGNGAQVNLGVPIVGVANNPVSLNINEVNNQQFVDGTGAVAQSANGPTPTSVESIVSAPLAGSTTTAGVTLLTGVFTG
jgi:hypothetical protein